MENEEANNAGYTDTEESGDYNEVSMTRPSLGSDGDYDDELGIPESIKVVDMGDGPVAIENSDEELENGLSYSTIHNYKKFTSYNRDVFIPGVDITAAITDYERNLTSHMLNPNLYTISLVHGSYSWQIKKRYKQIQHLHQQLVLFRTSLNIPFPSKTHKNKRRTFKENAGKVPKGKRKSALPRFPSKPEVLVSYDKLGNRMKQLENFLNNLLSITIYRNHPATIEFLEVSHLSFIEGLGFKGKEGMIRKKTGSTHYGQSGCTCFGLLHCFCCVRCQHICNDIICSRWVKRWFFIKDTFFGYMNPDNGQIRSVILFDQGFEVAAGMYSIGLKKGFQIQTLSRQMSFKCWTRRKNKEWTGMLKEVAATTAREFVQPNKNHSFAPIRINITASWFVDGASYMSTVADAIDNAKEEIFITDWWLSPEIYLKRPALVGDYWQLNKLLQRKAVISKGKIQRLTDLGSITPNIDTSTLRKKTSSVPAGDAIYPIPIPYYKKTPKPSIQEPEPVETVNCDPLPQLEPGDHLLMPCKRGKAKLNTPETERKHLIFDTIKNKGKELMNLVYNPHEDEVLIDYCKIFMKFVRLIVLYNNYGLLKTLFPH
nr:phospholipase D1-like [Leptinotarsa decemlineata]